MARGRGLVSWGHHAALKGGLEGDAGHGGGAQRPQSVAERGGGKKRQTMWIDGEVFDNSEMRKYR